MTDVDSHPASAESPPPSPASTGPPAPRWAIRVGVGIALAIVVYIVLDWLFWFVLPTIGLLPSSSPITGWTPTMYAVWIVVAVFAGAGYTLAPMPRYTPGWWAWRIAGGVALAVVLFLVLDSQVWYYLDQILPSNPPISDWPSPLYQLWIVVAVLLGARFALGLSRLFSVPWWVWRAVGGVLMGLGTYFAAVWLPLYLVPTVQSNGVTLANLSSWLPVVGILFALLVGAAYAAHPTRAFGPIEIGAGVLEILYLVVLIGTAPWAIAAHSIAASVGVTTVLLGLIIVILISMSGDVVTTVEDFARPGERRAWQYPVPVEPPTVPPTVPPTAPS